MEEDGITFPSPLVTSSSSAREAHTTNATSTPMIVKSRRFAPVSLSPLIAALAFFRYSRSSRETALRASSGGDGAVFMGENGSGRRLHVLGRVIRKPSRWNTCILPRPFCLAQRDRIRRQSFFDSRRFV